MRLLIEGTGYRSAAQAFRVGNRSVAETGQRLTDALAGYAGMAGDDATAADFAAAYDEAGSAAVDVLEELAGGFASLARLADASLRNHVAAESASMPSEGCPSMEPPADDGGLVVVLTAPPSALGGDSSSLPGWANAVLDLLEGAFWPDADADRLREAAGTWRSTATSVGLLAGHCESALGELAVEVSPEIPLAIATTEDLRARIEGLAEQLDALGAACEEHAGQVEATREQILGELRQLALELGIGAIVSGALTFLSAGTAAGVAGGAAASRLASASTKVRGFLESLGALSRGTATTVRPIGSTLRDTRAYLGRLSAARTSAMTERGSLRMFGNPRSRHWLAVHEKSPGHTLRQHVGLSDARLLKRLQDDPRKMNASTFTSRDRAERLIDDLLQSERGTLEAWLDGSKRSLRLDGTLPTVTGRSAFRDGHFEFVSGIRVVILRDSSMPEGFHILTSFPQP